MSLLWGNVNPGNCLFSDSGEFDIRRDHPHRRIEMKFCVVDGLQEVHAHWANPAMTSALGG